VPIEVSHAMSNLVLTIGPEHTVRDAARSMADRKVGAAIVIDPDSPGFGIITERDILNSIAEGQDPDHELVRDHLTEEIIVAAPDWSLDRAAETMVEGGFRHLLVVDGGDLRGVLSMRDIVRCWTEQHVISS
jgi:CBS domain-containing protein